MKFIPILLSVIALASARPAKREVPQEHSHQQFLITADTFLKANNPSGIVDVVFGLLGNAAAAGGAGSVTDLDCLQQITADTAFTNAKAANDVAGMTAALIYRTLERNTGQVGLASVLCTQTAKNPEIGALSQHQDPASPNAASINKQIALNLAVQIASIGGNPLDAIKSGTFAPGKIGDPTAKGNSCDDANDPVGCIFTQNLLVPDVTEEEINAAVAGGSTGDTASKADVKTISSSGATTVATKAEKTGKATKNAKHTKTDKKKTTTSKAAAAATSSANAGVCASAGNLGGPPPTVTENNSARPFSVDGSTFLNKAAACGRACDVQHKYPPPKTNYNSSACADAANKGDVNFTVGDCDAQDTACKAANS